MPRAALSRKDIDAFREQLCAVAARRFAEHGFAGVTLRGLAAELGALSPSRTVSLLVGPEGGFTAEEVDLARAAGVRTVSLGPRILRAETAGPVLAALVAYASGDLEPPR